MNFIIDNLQIRRPEFVPSEIPIIVIPFLLTMNHYSQFFQFTVLEGIVLFFLYFNFGDMINCLADRDLDAKYKSRLSKAVYNLGIKFVTWQIIITAILATAVAFHLAWSLDRWIILVLHLVALFFAGQYSVSPLHLKSGGVWQIPCLGAILFFLPMTYLSFIMQTSLHWTVYVILFAYATMQTGIVLVNTAEDYMEDKEMNLYTSTISLGISNSILLVNFMLFLGAGSLVVMFAMLFHQYQVSEYGYITLVITCGAWLFIQYDVYHLYRDIAKISLQEAAAKVKKKAKMVPIWLTFMAWANFFCALTILLNVK